MKTLVENFLVHLRHERGQAEHTERTYATLLNRFCDWAKTQHLHDWTSVQLTHLMSFLQYERQRPLARAPKKSVRRLSSESLYLEIAALRAFYRYAEQEKFVPLNVAENLSLPRRWKRLPKALTSGEITGRGKAEYDDWFGKPGQQLRHGAGPVQRRRQRVSAGAAGSRTVRGQ